MNTMIIEETGCLKIKLGLGYGELKHRHDLVDKVLVNTFEDDHYLEGMFGVQVSEQRGSLEGNYVIWVENQSCIASITHEVTHFVDRIACGLIEDAKVHETRELRADLMGYWLPIILDWYQKECTFDVKERED